MTAVVAAAAGALGFAAFLALLWAAVGAGLSWAAGWPALARRFPGGPPPPGPRLRGQVLAAGPVGERGVTALVPTAAGLYLEPHRLFRVARPPVLVPWAAVRHVRARGAGRRATHDVSLGGVTTLVVREAGWARLAPYLGAAPGAPAA